MRTNGLVRRLGRNSKNNDGVLLAIKLVGSRDYFFPPYSTLIHDFPLTTFESAAFDSNNDVPNRNDEKLRYHPPGRLGLPLPRAKRRRLASSPEQRSHSLPPKVPRHPQRHHQILRLQQQLGQLASLVA